MKYIYVVILVMVLSFNAKSGFESVGSAFTYQGQLIENGQAANGVYDFQMTLWPQETGGSQVSSAETVNVENVTVSSGLFNTNLDFGDIVFTGDVRYLQIAVRDGDSTGTYSTLSPRQRVNATPYAIQSEYMGNYNASTGQFLMFDGSDWTPTSLDASTTPWSIITGGIGYSNNVIIGNAGTTTNSMLTVDSDAAQSPVRFKIDGSTRLIIRDNGGTTIGANNSAPDNGLRVIGDTQLNGDLKQDLGKNGAIKAGVFIQCGSGINGGSERFFNNVNDNDFTTTQNGAGGSCTITVPFSVDNLFYAVSAEHPGDPFISRNASCVTHATADTLQCQINEISSAGVTSPNGTLQILFY